MKRCIILQCDNEHLHIAHLTLAKVEKFGWEMLLDPSYSVDLAPSDYQLFGPIKDHMKAKLYKNGAVSKPCLCCCQLLKWTSTTAAYSSFCSTGRNAWIILGILCNSDRTSPITHDNIYFCIYLCFGIK